MSFWRKCGKLITDGLNLIKCPYYNPCNPGYYAIFAFVKRSYDGSTGEVNYCKQPDLEVLPYNVLQGSINYYGRCIKISLQKDSKGRVGYYKGYLGSYTQVEIYRLGGCYDDYNEFVQYFYSKCPQITAPFPNVFNADDSISSDANNCISKNRDPNNDDSWYSYAYQRYSQPKVKLKVDNRSVGIYILMNQRTYSYITSKWCDGECLQWDDNKECLECNGTMYEDTFPDTLLGYHHGLYRGWQYPLETILQVPIEGIDIQGWGCEWVKTFNSASLAASGQILARAAEYSTDRNNYGHSYSESVIICQSGSYHSWACTGSSWNGYPDYNDYKQAYGATDLYFEKPDEMKSDAIGAEIKLKLIISKGTANNCRCHSIEDGEQIIQQELNVFWGQKIQLPIAHNVINGMKAVVGGDCDMVNYQPTDGDIGCYGDPCNISWSVEVKRLIFN